MLLVRRLVEGALACALVFWASLAVAQQTTPTSSDPASRSASAHFRRLAPGIETTIPVDRHESETFAQHDIVEILSGIPNLNWEPHSLGASRTLKAMATQAMFHKDVWCLEFTFKPMRMIWVDVPQAGGRAERKLIYYLVFHVKNPGQHLHPVAQPDGTYKIETVDKLEQPIRFMPLFSLESPEKKKAYLDRLIPAAIPEIQRREDPNRTLLNTVEISKNPIPVSTDAEDKSVWGVATWEDIDPTLDFFSVVVEGLTNAQKWMDPPGVFHAGDAPGTGRRFASKMLILNFWRPGDEFLQDERTIYFGAPGKIDYRWIYR
ncbi:MAG TPA: hypothetical protein VFE24_13775 [Pirellulales bacterium]|jgi:hypothetical protein|nr:hypothetical protein [Pirellulales bacterium]